MSKTQDLFGTLRSFDLGNGRQGALYALPELEEGRSRAGIPRAGLDPAGAGSVLRNCDGKAGSGTKRARAGELEADGAAEGKKIPSWWRASYYRTLRVCRCWWTWRRCAPPFARLGRNPKLIEPLCRWTRSGHSVQVDYFGNARGPEPEIWTWSSSANRERYES